MDNAFGQKKPKRRQPPWKCQVVVCIPASVAETSQKSGKADKHKSTVESEHLIRANSLAGYWELNRRFLRTYASNAQANAKTSPRIPNTGDETANGASLISPSAQISPDSLLGESTRVGERASIKKCVVGRHCNIGRGAKITGSILWDFVTVEEKYVSVFTFMERS